MRLQGEAVMKGDFLSPSDMVPVGTTSSSQGVKEEQSICKTQGGTGILFILPTSAWYRTSASHA